MMMHRFVTGTVVALSLSMDIVAPQASEVSHALLPNGSHIYVESYQHPTQWGSFRVVTKGSHEHTLYAFDALMPDWEAVDEFFLTCANQLTGKGPTPGPEGTRCSFPRTLGSDVPEEMAIIAVGNFTQAEILPFIVNHFGPCSLNASLENAELKLDWSSQLSSDQIAVQLIVPTLSTQIDSTESLKQCWEGILLQELLQQRFEACINEVEGQWIHPHPTYLWPVTGYALVNGQSLDNTLSLFFWQLKLLQKYGFYEDEFLQKKQQILQKLHYLNAIDPSPYYIATCYKDLFLMGNQIYLPRSFLSASVEAVDTITFDTLANLLDPFLLNSQWELHAIYSDSATQSPLNPERLARIATYIDHLTTLYNDHEQYDEQLIEIEDNAPLMQIREGTIRLAHQQGDALFEFAYNKSNATQSFYQLPLTTKDMELIESVISSIATQNIFQLAFNKRSIEKKGKKIEHVHPLRFMGYIMSQPSLKEHARTIKKSSFKWDAFIDGFAKRMREETGKNNIMPHLPGFAQLVGSTPEQLTPFIQRKDWEGLVKSLL